MYSERPSGLDGAVVWTRTGAGRRGHHRILPDGCLDLIWRDGELLVAGPDTIAHLATSAPGVEYAAVRFAPGTGPGVLGVPADELRDRRVPLSALWPATRARSLADAVADAPDRGRALERMLVPLFAPAEPWVGAVVARLRRGHAIGSVAAEVGLSERQLHRRCLASFGYGPKTLARVMRMRRAIGLARGGMAFAAVAVGAGYADQAHLARDVKSLAGVPLTALL